MNKKMLMLIAALTLGGAATANAATPAAPPAKTVKADKVQHTAQKAHATHRMAAAKPKKASKHS